MWQRTLSVLLFVIKDYFQNRLRKDLSKALEKAKEEFTKYLWDCIRSEVHSVAVEAVSIANNYLMSEGVKAKKEEILETVMQKVKLPLVLKPFRGLIKKQFSAKIDDMLTTIMQRAIDITG